MGATISKWYGRDGTGFRSGMATQEQYLNLVVSIHEGESNTGMDDEVPMKRLMKKHASCYYQKGSLMERCVEVVCEQLLLGSQAGDGIMQCLPAEVMQLLLDKFMVGSSNSSSSSLLPCSDWTPSRGDPGLGDGHVLHDAGILKSLEGCEFYDVCLDGAGYTRIEQGKYYSNDLYILRHNLFPKKTLERVTIVNRKPLQTSQRSLYNPNSLYDDTFLLQYVIECRKLRHLHLEYCDDVTEQSLSRILPGLPLLEVLRVRHCHNVRDMVSHLENKRERTEDSIPLQYLHTVVFESCLRASNLGRFLKLLGAKGIVNLQISRCSLVRNDDAMEIASLCTNLEMLHIGNTGITDIGLKCLGVLKTLRRFLMPGLRVRDSSIAYCLHNMMFLEELDVSRCFLAGDGTLASLADKKALNALSMMFTSITDDGLCRTLPFLNTLEYINFESCDVSDVGLVNLKHALGLRAVHLADTQSGNDTMEALSHLRYLSTLDVSFTNCINDIGIKFIGRMHGLHHLILESLDGFSSCGLRHLVHLTHLKTLVLFGCRITDRVCSIIANIQSLKKLDIGWGDLSSAGVKELSRLSNLRHISLAHCHCIRDDCVPFLLGMKRLSTLNISDCRISADMLVMLSSLPSLKVLCLADTPITSNVLKNLVTRNQALEIKGLK